MACDPKLIIADEPTTALDVTIQAQILELMKELTRRLDVALIIITHNLGVVARYANRVNVMYAGRIVESGPAAAIYHDPRHPYTIALLRSVPRLDRPRQARLDPVEGQPPDLTRLDEGCSFRPRCRFAIEVCARKRPAARKRPGGRAASRRLLPQPRDRSRNDGGADAPAGRRRMPIPEQKNITGGNDEDRMGVCGRRASSPFRHRGGRRRRRANDEEAPKRGGTLTYMIPADAPPSFDGHREGTYRDLARGGALLQRADPDQPGKSVLDHRFRLRSVHGDAAADRRRQDLYLQDPRRGQIPDGSPLTAADVAASWKQIIHPPKGVLSPRQSWYDMVDTVTAPDPSTVVFHLKFATSAFLPALADPFTFIYQKANLDKDPRWYEKNILGSGPFKFVEYQVGQSIKGVRNPDYYHKGLPYLDGFTGIFADKQAVRVDAIRADRAAIEFRGFPPSARDELKAALGDKLDGAGERLELRQPGHPQPQARSRSTMPGCAAR